MFQTVWTAKTYHNCCLRFITKWARLAYSNARNARNCMQGTVSGHCALQWCCSRMQTHEHPDHRNSTDTATSHCICTSASRLNQPSIKHGLDILLNMLQAILETFQRNENEMKTKWNFRNENSLLSWLIWYRPFRRQVLIQKINSTGTDNQTEIMTNQLNVLVKWRQ